MVRFLGVHRMGVGCRLRTQFAAPRLRDEKLLMRSQLLKFEFISPSRSPPSTDFFLTLYPSGARSCCTTLDVCSFLLFWIRVQFALVSFSSKILLLAAAVQLCVYDGRYLLAGCVRVTLAVNSRASFCAAASHFPPTSSVVVSLDPSSKFSKGLYPFAVCLYLFRLCS